MENVFKPHYVLLFMNDFSLGNTLKRMTSQTHKCKCMFIPIGVLSNVSAAGIEHAPLSVQQSKLDIDMRLKRVNKMEEFVSLSPVGTSGRDVYDCQNQWVKRVKLARDEGGPAFGDKSVDTCYDFGGKVRSYYKDILNRSSIDNASMNIIMNVHYGIKYMNATWDGDELTLGDGDGNIFTDFSKSLDVVAHEFTHGVTQWEANLIYDGQSGALNEHYSDVFGSVITQFIEKQTADTADWLIGDEIMGPQLKGEALRSMSEPGSAYDNPLMGKDPQPSHMDDYYSGPNDNHGVHINSGIPNKAFYLTSKAIGTDKAARIWYQGLQSLWATANFNDAVKVLVKSAGILVDSGEVPKGSVQAVRGAFRAVGLPH